MNKNEQKLFCKHLRKNIKKHKNAQKEKLCFYMKLCFRRFSVTECCFYIFLRYCCQTREAHLKEDSVASLFPFAA